MLRVGDLRAVLLDELAQALADRMFVLMDDRIGRVVLGQLGGGVEVGAAAGDGLRVLLTLALGQSIGGSVLGSLMSMSGAGTAFAAAAAAAALSALLPPSRLVSARTEEMNVLTQEQIRAHAERRSSS